MGSMFHIRKECDKKRKRWREEPGQTKKKNKQINMKYPKGTIQNQKKKNHKKMKPKSLITALDID